MAKRNVTISLDRELLAASQQFARQRGTTLNGLIRDTLHRMTAPGPRNAGSIDEFFTNLDRVEGDSGGKKWKRGDLYDV